jgi:6,7-dimethyl-8-ribityllumazine synthase
MAEVSNSKLLQINAGILNPNACVVIVRTEWNAAIVDELEKGCLTVFEREGVRDGVGQRLCALGQDLG